MDLLNNLMNFGANAPIGPVDSIAAAADALKNAITRRDMEGMKDIIQQHPQAVNFGFYTRPAFVAIEVDNADALNYLVHNGADLSKIFFNCAGPADTINMAARIGALSCLWYLLDIVGLPVDRTALTMIFANDVDESRQNAVIGMLLRSGKCSVNCVGENGLTPFAGAIANKQYKKAELLLEFGADFTALLDGKRACDKALEDTDAPHGFYVMLDMAVALHDRAELLLYIRVVHDLASDVGVILNKITEAITAHTGVDALVR